MYQEKAAETTFVRKRCTLSVNEIDTWVTKRSTYEKVEMVRSLDSGWMLSSRIFFDKTFRKIWSNFDANAFLIYS